MISVRYFHGKQFRCDRPTVVALMAGAIALLPIHGLQASSISKVESLKEAQQPHLLSLEISPETQSSRASTSDQPLNPLQPDLSPEVLTSAPQTPQTSDASDSSLFDPLGASTSPLTTSGLATSPILAEATSPNSAEVAQNDADPIPVYGQRGSRRWYVQGGAASNLDSDETRNFGLVGAGISHFFLDGNSINLELNGMAFDQPGDNAVGLNLGAILRWDFIRQQNWSLYIDGGAGLLGTTDSVPSDGSSFNFTPQAGGGATIRLNERNRLMVGVRWHHISNANTFDSNPGQDLIFGYVGINFPR